MNNPSHDPDAVNKAIGGRVAWYMRYDGGSRRTQAELAELLGVQQSAVSKKLSGARPFLPHELYAIAAWLDRPFTDLMPWGDLTAAPAPSSRSAVAGDAGANTQGSTTNIPGFYALQAQLHDHRALVGTGA